MPQKKIRLNIRPKKPQSSRMTASKVKRIVKGMAEKKSHVNTSLTEEFNATGAIDLTACQVAQGDSEAQRDGTKVRPYSLEIRGVVSPQGTSTSAFCRVMVIWTKGNDLIVGDLPAITGFIDYDLFQGKVLMDETFIVSEPDQAGELVKFHRYWRLDRVLPKGVQLQQYTDSAAASNTYGKCHICFIGNQAASAGNRPLCTYSTKYRYLDM